MVTYRVSHVALGLGLIVFACLHTALAEPQVPSTAASVASAQVAIAYTGETHAMIEPCNCPAEPLGGVARRAHEIEVLRSEFGDLLLLDGGGCFAHGIYDEYVQGDELDKQRTFVALRAMALMKYDAVCLGDDEFAFGQGAIKWAESALGLTFVSCNVQTGDGKPFVTPFIIKKVGGKNVLVTGVCMPEVEFGDYWQQFEGLKVLDPKEAVSKVLAEQRGKVDVVIVLSHLNEEASTKLAQEVQGIDVVFNSGRRTTTRRSFDVGESHVVNFDYQGRNLLLTRLRPGAADASQRFAVEEIPLSKEVPDSPAVASLVSGFLKLRDAGTVRPTVRLDLYMMSFCPYSKPAFKTLFELKTTFGDAVEPHVYYIVRDAGEGEFDSLHGEEEVEEDMRQLCVLKTQPEKFVSYVECVNTSVEGTSWQECASSVGIDTKALSECLSSGYPERELRSMAARDARLRVSASPTLYINNQRFGDRIDKMLLSRSVCTILGQRADEVAACKNLPKCLHDFDCPRKEGMIARCVNPATKQSRCEYDEAVKVPVSVVYDANSVASNEDQIINSTLVMMPGLEVNRVDASTDEGKRLIATYGLDLLPGYIFGLEALRARNFAQLKSAFERVNDKLVFRSEMSGASVVPSRPLIKGKLDVFISANAKAGLEGLARMIKLRDEGKLRPFEVHHIVYLDSNGVITAQTGLSELQEAQRQEAMLMQDGDKFDKYILLRAKEPENSYWEEPIVKAGFEPAKIKSLSASKSVDSKLEADASLCEQLRVGGALVFVIDNRETVPIANSQMLDDILKKLAKRQDKRTNSK
ncbi:MAG TPA: thioredoxin domain-containing protein [bacterium]|nr:thioredoxin domain-containing protein [bacterium]